MLSEVEPPLFSSRRLGRDLAVHKMRELYASGAHVEPTATDLFARVRARALPGMVAFDRSIDGVTLIRTAAEVRRTGFNHFTLQHVVGGEMRMDFGDDRKTLRAGDTIWSDTTKPVSITYLNCKALTLSVPREMITVYSAEFSLFNNRVMRNHAVDVGNALSAFTKNGGGDIAKAPIWRLIQPDARPSDGARHAESARRSRRENALTFIEAHLHRTDLSPDMVVAGVHTSRATLYRAFEELGGLSEWILSRRLRRLRTALTMDHRPLVDLIGDFGFVSLSHVTNAFRSRYGVSPGALRNAVRAESLRLEGSSDETRRLLDDIPSAFQRAPFPNIAADV